MRTLTARHLAKSYKGRQVVQDTSLTVKSGQIVGLLGPNGAGKTTSFYMIIGLVKADAGQVLLDDVDISQAPMHERARKGIGYLPQETGRSSASCRWRTTSWPFLNPGLNSMVPRAAPG